MRRVFAAGLLWLVPSVCFSGCGAPQERPLEAHVEELKVEIPRTLQWASAYCGQTQIDVQDLGVAPDGRIAILGALQGGIRDANRENERFTSVPSPNADVMTFYLALAEGNGEHISMFVPRGHEKEARAHSLQAVGDGSWVVGGQFGDALRLREDSERPELSHARGEDLFMLSFNDEGQPFQHIYAGGRGDESIQSVTMTPDGSLYFVGSYSQSLRFHRRARLAAKRGEHLFLAKVGDDGEVEWVRHLLESTHPIQDVQLESTSDGELVVLGRFEQALSYGEGRGATTLTSRGHGDVFLARFDGDGELRWIEQAGGDEDEAPVSLSINENDDLTVVARAGGASQFGRDREQESVNGSSKLSFIVAHYAGDDGSLHHVRRLGNGMSLNYASGTSLPEGGSAVVGGFDGELQLRGGEIGLHASPEGSVFVARLLPDDRVGRVETTEGGGGAIAKQVRVHPDGGVVVAGTFHAPLTLAPGAPGETELSCHGRPGVFVAHFTQP